LTYLIQFSTDNGSTWWTLDTDITDTTYVIALDQLEGTTEGLFRVQASDGFLISSDESDAVFTVASQPPYVYIVEPEDDATFFGEQLVLLEAEAEDAEDGVLSGASLEWLSSLDGPLGTGERLSRRAHELSTGYHIVTVTVTDSEGSTASDSVNVRIKGDATIADLALGLDGPASGGLTPGDQGVYRITITNLGPEATTGILLEIKFGDGFTLVSVTPESGNCAERDGRIECTLDSLDVGSSTTVELNVEATTVTTVLLEALAISDAFDNNLANNQIRRSIDIVSPLVPGDLDGDSDLDAADRAILRASLGACVGDGRFVSQADYNGNGCIDYGDYRTWYGMYRSYITNST